MLQIGEEELIVKKDFTQFAHEITKCMTANVTAFRFFSLSDAKATDNVVIEDIISPAANMNNSSVVTVGKAKAFARGFVWASKPEMANMGSTVCLAEVSGYDSIEDHWKWIDTPEYTEETKKMKSLPRDLGLKAVDVLGRRRSMVEGSGVLHVKFRKIESQ
jgi:hypothetical protein